MSNIFAVNSMNSKHCFVIQPFDKGQFDKRYIDIFVPAIQNAGLEPYRVDQDPSTMVLIESIEQGIKSAQICLADISTDNPNVWYELGYALASDKSVVLVCENQRSKFPFDIQHRSIIQYASESSSDFEKLKQQITAKIKAYLNDIPKTESTNTLDKNVGFFDINWYDIDAKKIIGKELTITHPFLMLPDDIPNYYVPAQKLPFAYSIATFDKINIDYYREFVEYLFKTTNFFPVAISVKNIGHSIAKDVRVEIIVNNEDVYGVYEQIDIPDKEDIPKKRLSMYDKMNKTIQNIRPMIQRDGDLEITKEFGIFKIETGYSQIQMGRAIYCDPFYIAKQCSGQVKLHGTIFSQLPPVEFELILNCDIAAQELTMERVYEITNKCGHE